MKYFSKLMPFLPIIIFGVVVGIFLRHYSIGRDPSALPSMLLDKPAPRFALKQLDADKTFSEKDFLGRVTVVNFFASWCSPCHIEHPYLYGIDRGALVLGIAYKDSAQNIGGYLKDMGNPYRLVLMDESGLVGIDWGLSGVPETFVVDKGGTVRYRYVGSLTAERVQQEINPLIAALNK